MSQSKAEHSGPRHGSTAIPQIDLWGGKSCDVPEHVAKCPECGHTLHVYCHSWDAATGKPWADELQIDCQNERFYDGETDTYEHRWHQSDWQSVRDEIVKWAGARLP